MARHHRRHYAHIIEYLNSLQYISLARIVRGVFADFTRQLERLWIVVAASALALLIVSLMFAWMPAQAAYAYYGFARGEGPG